MRKTTMTGSVSHGTMRPEDLIPCFLSVADSIRAELAAPGPTNESPDETMGRSRMVGKLDDLLGGIEGRIAAGYLDDLDDDVFDDLDDLFTILDELAPEGFYFGAIEGDGSDYGFWSVESDTDEA